MLIAISKASGSPSYSNYEKWLRAADPDITTIDLSVLSAADAVARLADCAGVLLSGGEDINPDRYGQPEKTGLCGAIDDVRDEIELAVIRAATERGMPILGICRGMQILNVAFGGTLIADIPTAIATEIVHGKVDGADSTHDVEVEPGSLIKRLCRVLDGTVNSAHHQAVEYIAGTFTIAATSADGVVEAIEYGDAALGGKPFLLGVQWHPERMDYTNPLSLPIANAFVHECEAYDMLLKKK